MKARKHLPKRKSKLDRITFTPTGIEGKRAALYVRVSSDEFKKNEAGEKEYRASVETQIAELKEYATREGWDWRLYKKDCNRSGVEDEKTRSDLNRLINDIEAGRIHTVLVREHRRLSRNSLFTQHWIFNVLYPNGVNYLATSENIDIVTQDGLLLLGIRAWQGQADLVYIATRSKAGKQLELEKGCLRTTPCFGYGVKEENSVRFTYTREDEKKVVQELYERFIAGETINQIRHSFLDKGYVGRNGKNTWANSHLSRMMRRSVYKGILVYNGQEHATPYEAIIDADTWNEAQVLLDQNKRTGSRTKSSRHLVTGILRCGYCHDRKQDGTADDLPHPLYENMVANTNSVVNRRTKKKRSYFAWQCQTARKYHKKACPQSVQLAEHVLNEFLERYVVLLAVQLNKDLKKTVSQQRQRKDKLKTDLVAIAADTDRVIERRMRAEKMFVRGRIEEEALERLLNESQKALAELQVKTKDMTRVLAALAPESVAKTVSLLQRWKSLTIQERKKVLSSVIPMMLLYRDRLVLHFDRNPNRPLTVPLKRGICNRLEVGNLQWWKKKALTLKMTFNFDEAFEQQD